MDWHLSFFLPPLSNQPQHTKKELFTTLLFEVCVCTVYIDLYYPDNNVSYYYSLEQLDTV